MLELGAYWSFYSMWCQQAMPQAKCYMVEPEKTNLYYGKENFKINACRGTFLHAGVGKVVDQVNNIITVDYICDRHNISYIDILHVDIQGFEMDMLQGAEATLSQDKVGYLFLSTHSNELFSQILRSCKFLSSS